MTTADFIRAMEDQIAMWGNVTDTEPDMAAAAIEAACAAIRRAKADEAGKWSGLMCGKHVSEQVTE